MSNKSSVTSTSPDIVNKTAPIIPALPSLAQPSQPAVSRSNIQNVLNDYRSFTYNFTLSALKRTGVSDPKTFLDSEKNLMILSTRGKGDKGITPTGTLSVGQFSRLGTLSTNKADRLGESISQSTADIKAASSDNVSLVQDFNQLSPGRFDMFIDDVIVETLMAFEPRSNVTLPTKIEFTVMEPYSINGFIEAIHVAAVAAGYDTYVGASFLLKVEFMGYLDTDSIDTPAKSIPNSSRYFPFVFTGLEVTLTEKGTQYRCSAVPFNERGFGEPNNLKKSISVFGNNIFEVLNNFMKGVNEQVAETNKAAKTAEAAAAGRDEYAIEFRSLDPTTKKMTVNNEGAIPKAELTGFFSGKTLHTMPDPGDLKKPDGYKDNKDKQPTTEQQAARPHVTKLEPSDQGSKVQFADQAAIHECISVMIRDSDYVRKILKTISSANYASVIDVTTGLLDYFIVTMEVTHSDKTDPEKRTPFKKFTYVVSPYRIHYTQIPGYKATVIDAAAIKSISLRQYNYIYTGNNVDVLNFKLNFNTLFFEAIPAAMGNNTSPSDRNAASRITSNNSTISATDPKTSLATPTGTPPIMDSAKQTGIGVRGGQIQDSPYSVLAVNMHDAIINSKASMLTGTLDILGDPFYLITGGVGNYSPVGHETIIGMTQDGSAANNHGIVLIDINFRNPVDIDSGPGGLLIFDEKKVAFSGVYMVTQARSKFKNGEFKQELEILRMPGQIVSTSLPVTNPAKVQPSIDNPAENPMPPTDESLAPSVRADSASLTTLSRGVLDSNANFTAAIGGFGSLNLSNTLGLNTAIINDIMNTSIGGINPLTTGFRLSGLTAVSNTLADAASINQAANTLSTGLPISAANAAAQLASTINSKSSAINAISQNAQNTVASLGSSAASLVSGVGSTLNSLAGSNPFGVVSTTISGITGLSGMTSKIFGQLTALKANMPAGIEFAASRGVIVNPATIANLPASPADLVAPDPEPDTYTASNAATPRNLLASANNFVSDATSLGGKILTASAQISNITKSIQSPEALLNSINAAASPVNFGLAKSAADLFGSKSTSPLAGLLSTSDKSNAG